MIFELFELFEFWTLWILNSLNFELFGFWTLWILNSLNFELFVKYTFLVESERLYFGVAPHIFQIICFTNMSGKGELWRFEQQWRLCWCDPGLWGWSTGWSSQGDAQLPHFPPVVLQSTTRRCWAAWDRMWSTSWGKTATASQLSSLPSAWLCLTPGVIYKEQPHLQHGARGCQGYHPQPAYIWGLKRASILNTISWSVLVDHSTQLICVWIFICYKQIRHSRVIC